MAIIEPWQIAEIPGPKKATVISRPEVVDAMIKRSKRPVMIVGHLAAEVTLDDKKLIDYLIDIGKTRDIPIIATGNTNLALMNRGYTQATIMTAVDAGNRLTDREWKGLDGKGPHDLAIFAGLPYYMAWTILSGLKHFAPQVRTLSLDNGYQPHASFSFANIRPEEWRGQLDALTGRREG
jgi:acetyl-CoA decarbonylase/synthase complex subunit epsilon